MDYNDACSYLDNCYKFGSKRGHTNLKRLLNLLGNPQDKLKIIHIAGTNGKGSCCAFLSSVLREEGYNVGVFTSPHLIKYNERFKINDKDISDNEFCREIEKVQLAVNKLFKDSEEYFAFFEIITAAAFCWFNEKNVDYVILEVGLGGRLDATNVIEKSVLSVITSISLDHTQILGDTVEKIAYEKGGIIKKNCPVVLYCQGEKVYNVIDEICREKNAPLFYTNDYQAEIIKEDFNSTIFNAKILDKAYKNVEITMLGDYQIKNALNGLMCVEALKKNGVEINEKAVYNGFKNAYISGRMEKISDFPCVFLDGAHNVGGCEELCSFLKGLKENGKKISLLMGVLADKSFNEMINDLSQNADNIVFTMPDNKRGLEAKELYNCLEDKEKCVFYDDDYKKAFDYILNFKDSDVIICCGSLYLIGDLKKYYEEKKENDRL